MRKPEVTGLQLPGDFRVPSLMGLLQEFQPVLLHGAFSLFWPLAPVNGHFLMNTRW